MTLEQENEMRENLRGKFTVELAQLVSRAHAHGLVLEVELRRASPLVRPMHVFSVRHARGHYLKDSK